jgi:hypothetical protein
MPLPQYRVLVTAALTQRWQDARTMSSPAPTPADSAAHAKVLEAERELRDVASTRPQDPTRLVAALEQAVDVYRRWPQAASNIFYLPELLEDLRTAAERVVDRDRPADRVNRDR